MQSIHQTNDDSYKIDKDWPAGFRDFLLRKCGRMDGRMHGRTGGLQLESHTISSPCEPTAQMSQKYIENVATLWIILMPKGCGQF